ncbi:MAG: DNA polymerase III subunit epsilon [Proteobacteria bacterium]|nr:DNA polymerase III subunit epsilon [Pseudomonadota bacterium]
MAKTAPETQREIVLDTETTGLDPDSGDRIVEIGCVELINRVPTGRTFQCYLNPERDIPEEALAVHGLSREFLSRHPLFSGVVEDFLEFLGSSPLVIHNAEFDLGFINAELGRLDRPPISLERAIDTVRLARNKFPGAQASLDALCRRFQIDTSDRDLHGALKDAQLLVLVYVELTGGRQTDLRLAAADLSGPAIPDRGSPRPPRPHGPTAEELAAHEKFLDHLERPIWRA